MVAAVAFEGEAIDAVIARRQNWGGRVSGARALEHSAAARVTVGTASDVAEDIVDEFSGLGVFVEEVEVVGCRVYGADGGIFGRDILGFWVVESADWGDVNGDDGR